MDSTSSTSQIPLSATSCPDGSESQKPKRSKSASNVERTADDIDKLRRQSTMRLWKVWESLSERYARPLEEDDIIDFRDNRLVQDRGILRKLTTDFGELSSEPENGDDTEWEKDKDDVVGSEDPDELNSLNPVSDIANEMARRHGLMKRQIRSPSVDDDLQEFLAAEERRKQLYGDVDADLEEDVVERECISKSKPRKDHVRSIQDSLAPEGRQAQYASGRPPPPLKDADSDDELGIWSRDETSIVYHISHTAQNDEDDDGSDDDGGDDGDVPDDRSVLSSVSISSTGSGPSLPPSSPPPLFSDDLPLIPQSLGRLEDHSALRDMALNTTTPPQSLSSIMSSSATPDSTSANHARLSKAMNSSLVKRFPPPRKTATPHPKPSLHKRTSPDHDSPPIKIIKNPIRPPNSAISTPTPGAVKGKVKAYVAPVDKPPGPQSTSRTEPAMKAKPNRDRASRNAFISMLNGLEDDRRVGSSKISSLSKPNDAGSFEARKSPRTVHSWLDELPDNPPSPGLLVASSPVKSTKTLVRHRSVASSGITHKDHVLYNAAPLSREESIGRFTKKKRRRSSTISPGQRKIYDSTPAGNSPRRTNIQELPSTSYRSTTASLPPDEFIQIRAQMIRHLDHVMAERGLVPPLELLPHTVPEITSAIPGRGPSALYSTPHRSRSYHNPYTPTFSRATLPPTSSSPGIALSLSESEDDDAVQPLNTPKSDLGGHPSPTKRLKRYSKHDSTSSPPPQPDRNRNTKGKLSFNLPTHKKREDRRADSQSPTRHNDRVVRSLAPGSSDEDDGGRTSARQDQRTNRKPRPGSASSSLTHSSHRETRRAKA